MKDAYLPPSLSSSPSDPSAHSAPLSPLSMSLPPRSELSWTLFYSGCVLLVSIQLSMALFSIYQTPLLDPDEPRYAAAGRTMAEGGSWLIPEFNGQPRINKPPLFYWCVAGSVWVGGGSDELTSRAPSILMGLLMLAATLFLAVKLFDRRTALVSGAILLTFPLYIALSRTCITDMTLSALLSVGLTFWVLFMSGKMSPAKGLWLSALFLGLALLTKATAALCFILPIFIERAMSLKHELRPRLFRFIPWVLAIAMGLSFMIELDKQDLDGGLSIAAQVMVGCVLVLIVTGAYRAGLGPLKGLPWKWALLFSFALGAWWYAALTYEMGWERFRELLSFEVGGRMSGKVHREGMYFYLVMVMGITFPWSIGLPSAVLSAWTGSFKNRECNANQESSETSAERFLLAWFFGIILFYSIPGAKLVTYLLPALPAAAILLAHFILRMGTPNEPSQPLSFLWKILTIALAVVTICVMLVVTFCPFLLNNFQLFLGHLQSCFYVISGVVCLGFGGGWLLAVRGYWSYAVSLIAASTVAVIFLLSPALQPGLESRSTRKLCLKVKDRLSDVIQSGRIASVGAEVESLSYYLHTTVHEARRRRLKTKEEEDEPLIAVILEEFARNENVALFIQRRYCHKIWGIDRKIFAAYTREQIIQSRPPNSQFVDMDEDIIILRN